ncbi:MAG: glucosamine-fructose-6-phosphate aminotransferase [Parcubacteria group bacterium Gr01-1014_33]|nr:MAG: glucosamine-fructose-6-phosphate aminotransferase [Parcubacteria group bacterium Gr01-1014_33]
MCGIIGYIGKQNALPILMEGLKKMEYRGYDSAGVAVCKHKSVFYEKALGKIAMLEEKLLNADDVKGTLGIGHSRWATHGGVTEENAHPHSDCKGEIWLVHNGIIENHRELKNELLQKGHRFKSETDTEVIAHLIEEELGGAPFEDAARNTLKKIRGTYGLCIMYAKEPEKLIAARNFSPLLLGIGKGEYFVASDASALLAHTKQIVYLDDGEIAVLTRAKRRIPAFYAQGNL